MEDEREENERALTAAASRVREFAVQQVKAGHQAYSLSFALAFIATEMGLYFTHGRNPLGVIRPVLLGVIAAAAAFTTDGHVEAPSETQGAPTVATDAVPTCTVIH